MTEHGSAPGQLNGPSAVRSLDLGDTRVTYVVDGAMALLPAAFFPAIPAEYWAGHPEELDEQGRVAMSAGALLVRRGDRLLLIDLGMGEAQGAILADQAQLGWLNCGCLPDTLAALGHQPEDVEAAAFTHLHVDHTGWAFVPDGAGGYRKFFPNARYLVASEEWVPHSRRETVPGAPEWSAVLAPMADAHTKITDGEEIFPGVRAMVTPGHTNGHTCYVISTSAGRLVAFGDAFHVPAQLTHPEWPSLPDVDPDQVLPSRRRVLAELAKPDTIGFAIHFGDQAFGRVETDANGAAHWVPIAADTLLPPPRVLVD